MEPTRKFKIIVNSKECGTCSGATPSAVAKKVVKKLCGNSSKAVKFSLKECKRGCERVCGPYQGRMEKLDKPYKRDGKTITHRVVCGKVRKMRGGRDLVAEDFSKEHYIGEFTIKEIDGKKYFFIGGDDDNYYSLVYYYPNDTDKNVKMLFDGQITDIDYILFDSLLKDIIQIEQYMNNKGHVNVKKNKIENEYHHLYYILQEFYNNIVTYNYGEYLDTSPIQLMETEYGTHKDELIDHHRKILAKKISKKIFHEKINTIQMQYDEEDFTDILSDEKSIKKYFGLEYDINMKNNENIRKAIYECREYLEFNIRQLFILGGVAKARIAKARIAKARIAKQ